MLKKILEICLSNPELNWLEQVARARNQMLYGPRGQHSARLSLGFPVLRLLVEDLQRGAVPGA